MQPITAAPITKGTKVFVAADIDVPVVNGQITELFRLKKLLPTLLHVMKNDGIPIIAGKIGSPQGKAIPSLSTKQLSNYFENNLGHNNYVLLENLRFDPGEEACDPNYAKKLIAETGATIYVNENFATSHRPYASITEFPKLLPSYAGLNFLQEIQTLSTLLKNPEKPFVVVIGGAKLESKKPLVTKFLEVADTVLVGGKIGLQWQGEIPKNLLLPVDYTDQDKDLGQTTIDGYSKILQTAKTVLWAGPVGRYEDEKYLSGTKQLAYAIIGAIKNNQGFGVIGGGDTIAAVSKLNLLEEFSFVSTGGGAMLEYLANGTLPGIEALNHAENS